MWRHALVVVALAGASTVAAADTIGVNAGSNTAEFDYATGVGNARLDAGALYNHDSDDWAADLGLLASGDVSNGATRVTGALGGKLFGASASSKNVLALGLGGEITAFPGNGPIGLGGFLYYAPDALTGADARRFWEGGARVEFQMIRDAAALSVGYRKVHAELDNGNGIDIARGVYVGVSIHF